MQTIEEGLKQKRRLRSQAAVSIASMQTIEEGLIQKRRLRSVASVWGAEFVQFLAALAVLPWSI